MFGIGHRDFGAESDKGRTVRKAGVGPTRTKKADTYLQMCKKYTILYKKYTATTFFIRTMEI